MGVDFIEQKKQGFRKMFDGGKSALVEPDLLPSDQEWEEQHVLFEVHDGCTLAEGEQLVVQISGSTLIAMRGNDIVATAGSPPESVVTAMRRAHGYVVARVTRFSAVSRTADLAFRLQ